MGAIIYLCLIQCKQIRIDPCLSLHAEKDNKLFNYLIFQLIPSLYFESMFILVNLKGVFLNIGIQLFMTLTCPWCVLGQFQLSHSQSRGRIIS